LNSRLVRDRKRHEAYRSRKPQDPTNTPMDTRTTPQFPDPTTLREPSTTPCSSDTHMIPLDSPTTPQPPAPHLSMASHQKTKAGRFHGLEKTGAGNEERAIWQPAVLFPIPQLGGLTTPRPPETTTTSPVRAITPQPPALDQPLVLLTWILLPRLWPLTLPSTLVPRTHQFPPPCTQ